MAKTSTEIVKGHWIALCGSASSGKSTLWKAMQKDSFFSDYFFKGEILRDLKDRKDVKLNEETTDESQKIINEEYDKILGSIEPTAKMVMDRSLLCSLCYITPVKEKGNLSNSVYTETKCLFEKYLSNYEYIILTTSDGVKFEDCKYRSSNKEYQKTIHNLYLEFAKRYGLNDRMIIVSGPTEERLKQIKDFITEKELDRTLKDNKESK